MTLRRGRLRAVEPAIAEVAALIGDPSRATMLCALNDGDELSAGELALRAGLAPNAASLHLAKLVAGGLIVGRSSGRQRFFRLSSEAVGRAIETLAVISPSPKIVALQQSHIARELRDARSCYDHLAGRLGVAVTEALVARNIIVPMRDRNYRLTDSGEAYLRYLGVEVDGARESRRNFARQCLDWSERRSHLAGSLGAGIRDLFLRNAWVRRMTGSRALRLTDRGRAMVKESFAIEL